MNVEESPRERKVHRIISDSISEIDVGVDSLGRIRITGGIPLDGEVRIQGSKNAALPIMAAALLNRGTTVLKGCPRIADVFLMEQMLRDLGARTCWQGGTLEICARELKSCVADKELLAFDAPDLDLFHPAEVSPDEAIELAARAEIPLPL